MKDFKTAFSEIESEIENSKYSKLLKEIKQRSASAPVILYGAGTAAGFVIASCNLHNIPIAAICDSKKNGVFEKSNLSFPIINVETLFTEYSNAVVIISSWKFENEIRQSLLNMGFESSRIFTLYFSQRISLEEFTDKYYEKYATAYAFFKDDVSKQTILDIASSFLTSKPRVPNTSDKMYYESDFVFGENEVFVDGGAADGDTVNSFIEQVNGKYKYIYAFEPDVEPYEKMANNNKQLPNFGCYNVGLGSDNRTELFYYDGLMASGFDEMQYFLSSNTKFNDGYYKTNDCVLLGLDSLNIFGNVPTFIKLDIEGYEKEALLGAKNIIKQYKPKLAICAYHKIDDVYTLPQTIHEIRDDYKFILRQCDYGYYETVLYAW